jgi:uncharacterized damage-inducible protein DinB
MSEGADLAAKLQSEGERLLAFFGALGQGQWEAEVYTDGAVWTVRNTLAHLMTSERAFTILFEQIRQGGSGVTEDFAIDRYNASQQRKTMDLRASDLLQSFRQARAAMVTWVSGLAEEDLEKRGRHPFLGVTSLREMLKMVYIHNQVHYRDVRRALKD